MTLKNVLSGGAWRYLVFVPLLGGVLSTLLTLSTQRYEASLNIFVPEYIYLAPKELETIAAQPQFKARVRELGLNRDDDFASAGLDSGSCKVSVRRSTRVLSVTATASTFSGARYLAEQCRDGLLWFTKPKGALRELYQKQFATAEKGNFAGCISISGFDCRVFFRSRIDGGDKELQIDTIDIRELSTWRAGVRYGFLVWLGLFLFILVGLGLKSDFKEA